MLRPSETRIEQIHMKFGFRSFGIRRLFWIGTLALISCILQARWSYGSFSCDSVNSSQEFVEVLLANKSTSRPRLRIPRGYFGGTTPVMTHKQMKGGILRGVNLTFSYPDFRPWNSRVNVIENSKDEPFYLSLRPTIGSAIQRIWKLNHSIFYSFSGVTDFDVDKYIPNPKLPISKSMSSVVYYSDNREHVPRVIIQCPSREFSVASCRLITEFKAIVSLELAFPNNRLSEWKEILGDTFSFIECLIQDDG